MCAYLIYLCIASHLFLDQRPSALVDNQRYVLASHERLYVHMDLPTAVTGISSVGNTKAVKGRTGGAVEDLKGVAYLQYIIYGGVDRKVNDAITFEQSNFSEIHESKTIEVSCLFW